MILNELGEILQFIGMNYLRIWPFILITLPISVAIHISGVGSKIKKILMKKPVISVFLATLIGALSPLCSCTIIPVIASMLIAGVPLAPVMAFWMASPSMDPEIFFLSAVQLNLSLAIWRLVATFLLSLAAGYITLFLENKGFFKSNILKDQFIYEKPSFLQTMGTKIKQWIKPKDALLESSGNAASCCSQASPNNENQNLSSQSCQCSSEAEKKSPSNTKSAFSGNELKKSKSPCCSNSKQQDQNTAPIPPSIKTVSLNSKRKTPWMDFFKNPENLKLLRTESLKFIIMILKFMTLAFFLEALIKFYLPTAWIDSFLGQKNFLSIIAASLIGVPLYTSGLAALGIIAGLMSKGMLSSAALAFLIAGPVTTIPAMSAVYGIVKPRIFILYLAFAFGGSLFFGLVHFVLTL